MYIYNVIKGFTDTKFLPTSLSIVREVTIDLELKIKRSRSGIYQLVSVTEIRLENGRDPDKTVDSLPD